MTRFLILLDSFALGLFLSTIAYMHFFHTGINLERSVYLITAIGMLSTSLLLSRHHQSKFLVSLVISGVLSSIGYSILYVYFSVYKGIYTYSSTLEISLFAFAVFTFSIFVFHKKPSLEMMYDQLETISFRPVLFVFLTITIISIILKVVFGYLQFSHHIFDFLTRASDVLWVVWSYVFVPTLLGSFFLLLSLKLALKKRKRAKQM